MKLALKKKGNDNDKEDYRCSRRDHHELHLGCKPKPSSYTSCIR